MYITYYADNSTMGDNTANDCAKYRAWAWEQLIARYPAHDITVAQPNVAAPSQHQRRRQPR